MGQALLRVWVGWDRCHLRVLAITLFFSPAVNLLAKRPILGLLLRRFHLPYHPPEWPWWFAVLGLLVVGVCEEGIKATPALFPSVREAVRSRGSAVPMALTIGLGFALGEIWFVAWAIYHTDPTPARLPFYMLGGFIGERLFTIILHSFLIFPALHGLLTGPSRFALGLAAGMLLHALVDAVAALYQMKLVGQELTGLLLLAITLGAAIPLYKYARHRASLNRSALLSTSSRVLYVRRENDAPPQK
jgi:uncharacterized membrane protein YhfC